MGSAGIWLLGDSNGHSGEANNGTTDEATHAKVYMWDRATSAKILATESLMSDGTHGHQGMKSGCVGHARTVAMGLADAGLIPSQADDITLICTNWAGVSMTGGWAVDSGRSALDNAYTQVQAFLDADPTNFILCSIWCHGRNDGGRTQAQYTADLSAIWSEARDGRVRTAQYAPIFVVEQPQDYVDPSLGPAAGVTMGGVDAAIADVENYIANSYYISTSGLPSYLDNSFIHFGRNAHVGGAGNSLTANATRDSGSWYWVSGDTYVSGANTGLGYQSGDHVLGSDEFAYKLTGADSSGDPTTDGGVNWTKTGFQRTATVADPVSSRILARFPSLKYPMLASW